MSTKRKKIKDTRIDTLVGRQTGLCRNVRFSGRLHVDGTIKGNVVAEEFNGIQNSRVRSLEKYANPNLKDLAA